MALRGDLASVDLAQVFQMLALNKKVGLLSIHSAKLWKVLYFDQRGVTVHHNVHAVLDRVVAAFVRSGRLQEQALEEARDHSLRMGQPLADSLLAGGYLDAAELEDQYRFELEEEVYDLFFCREARFEFHERVSTLEGRDGIVDERFFFNCDSVIMEAARRIDEWAFISERIPSTAEVLVATADSIDAEDYGPDGPAVFELLDGRRNVARVIEVTGLSNFLVCKTLSQLLDAGAIAPVAQEELVPLGNECMQDGRLKDAIALYERAIELEVGLPESHSLVAKAYQAAEEYELAVYHLECEAEHRVGSGDLAGAARCLFEVRRMMPTDLQARERLVELALGQDGVKVADFDPLAEGKALVELLTEFGDIQRVRALLERLLLVEPNDPDLKKALVNVHVRAGDQTRVVQLYESIADDLVRQNKPLEAVGYLQKILLIDRSRSDISERVRRLYEFDERARRRSRMLSVLAVLFCLLLVAGSGYWFYNERAEEDFAQLDVRDLVEHEDFAAARGAFEAFLLQHPLTTAVQKAKAELQKIETAEQLFNARRDKERAAVARALQKLRAEYKAEWARHREQFLAGHPEVSFEALGKVRELVAKAGAAEDLAWALEQQVERAWTNLQEFLAESRRLATVYDEKVAAGDWAGARVIALRLQEDFDHTESARRALVPVMVVTRPAGAVLLQGDQPLTRLVDGKAEPVTTPGLVLVGAAEPARLVARLDGFEPRELIVDGKQAGQLDAVLTVVPLRRISFAQAVQTGVGIGDGWLAVGLRGGKLAMSRVDGGSRQELELGGLKEVEGTPRVQGGRVFFATNENTIECVAVEPGLNAGAWPVQLTSPVATPLMAGEGRVAVVDEDRVLHCYEQSSGRRLWGVALEGLCASVPTIDRRRVFVGTADGRLMVFDATDGRSVGMLRCQSGICTRVLVDDDELFFGCADGAIRAVDLQSGKVRWTVSLGRTPTDDDLALAPTAVLTHVGGELLAIDRHSGVVRARQAIAHPIQRIGTAGARALVQLGVERTARTPAHASLLAVDANDLRILWEHELDGPAPGCVGADDQAVAQPSGAEVILFR
ncbi:MAG: PQQ-binding-like beta-propeller repeat protein [Planctomycetes bacterium]|nr:PQQ-binding-like beta-propeller repeat protein [Planctomycetota bacterium]